VILSDENRYVFVEMPHTGSYSIANELCELYGGERVLHKHALYPEFLREATPEQRRYFAFSGVRNPLDEAVSLYFFARTNRYGHYTKPHKLRRRAGGNVSRTDLRKFRFIHERDADFVAYFSRFYRPWRFYRLPYDNLSCVSHDELDLVIRYERIDEDFGEALGRIGIEQARPLPRLNRTGERQADFAAYYTPEIRNRAQRVFGPFMRRWDYELPPGWEPLPRSRLNEAHFRALRAVRRLYWGSIRYHNPVLRWFEHYLP
jgi:hypothetical protein